MVPTNMPVVLIDVNMFWQIINFFIMVFLFKKYLKAPLVKMMDSRKEKIAAEFSEAQKNKEEAALKNKESETILKEARLEANKIIQLAERKADERRTQIVAEASEQRDKMLRTAKIDIEKMTNTARKELEIEMNKLAVTLAEKIIKENLDSNLDIALANKFIDDIGGEK